LVINSNLNIMKRLVLTLAFTLLSITMFAGNYISKNVEPYAPAFAGTYTDPEELEGYVEVNGVFYWITNSNDIL